MALLAKAVQTYFHVEQHTVRAETTFTVGDDSFVSVLVLNGQGVLSFGGEDYALSAGVSYFLPAGMGDYTVKGEGGSVNIILSRT